MWLYNLGIYFYSACLWLASPFVRKAKLLFAGRKGLIRKIEEAIPPGSKIFWIHAASLGEFEQGRPVIEDVRAKYPDYKILLTFFSPSGYEIRKDYMGADLVFYLPSDTPRNVRRFLDVVNPEIALFVKYEFWLNYLNALGHRNIRTYIISAIFRPDSIFFRPYGGMFRRVLSNFTRIFVQDQPSRELLAGIGVDNVTVAGDTRFDRVGKIADGAKKLPVLDDFTPGCNVLVAGSTWQPDEDILVQLINANPDMKFVVAPHEMDDSRIDAMMNAVAGGAVRYTRYSEDPRAKERQLLVIDTIGILSSVYSYGNFAYIGGGFGVGIHNTLEAAAFGIPLAFGPNYRRFREACELIADGAARSISDYEELSRWLSELRRDKDAYEKSAVRAGKYVNDNRGATEAILSEIM